MSGHVSLVGAGPGDPGLLTRKAIARLRAADLVLYDALVDAHVLSLADVVEAQITAFEVALLASDERAAAIDAVRKAALS